MFCKFILPGFKKILDIIVDLLKDGFNAENIFTKNEAHFRKLEFLPEEDQIFLGDKKEEIIDDGVIKYKIDFVKRA